MKNKFLDNNPKKSNIYYTGNICEVKEIQHLDVDYKGNIYPIKRISKSIIIQHNRLLQMHSILPGIFYLVTSNGKLDPKYITTNTGKEGELYVDGTTLKKIDFFPGFRENTDNNKELGMMKKRNNE